MPSDMNPLPASEFRRLADDAIDRLASALQFLSEEQGAAVHAYRAARAASPVTLEEHLLIDEYMKADAVVTREWIDAVSASTDHARTLAETDNARRLAGEGGA